MESRFGRHVSILAVTALCVLASCQTPAPLGPCNPNPCTEPNKGRCIDNGGAAVCSCDQGYHWNGTHTACTQDPCDPNPCAESNKGQCINDGGAAVCGCDAGYHDESGACVKDTTCGENTCNKHGTCDDSTGVLLCTCYAGYTGSRCDSCDQGYHWNGTHTACTQDPCDPNPCTESNKGQCTNDGGVAVCSCDAGYHWNGTHTACTQDPCDPNPCTTEPNKGQCTDNGGAAVCGCDAGYHDESGACVKDMTCGEDTCNKHGNCDDSTGVLLCTCYAGYTGANCDSCDQGYHWNGAHTACTQDPCDPDPCSSHGTCSQGTCTCRVGYAGASCNQCATGYTGYPNCVPIFSGGFCQESCSSSVDCYKNGSPIGVTCNQNMARCVMCQANSECQAHLSLWWAGAACSSDANCLGSGTLEACIAVQPGVGHCAFKPSFIPCANLGVGWSEVNMNRIGGGTVQVCGVSGGVCTQYGTCFLPCAYNAQCIALFSGWNQPCTSDSGCQSGYGCIDAGQGHGYCAMKPSPTSCASYGMVQVARNRVGTSGTLDVCALRAGSFDATCGADGFCRNPCASNIECVAGFSGWNPPCTGDSGCPSGYGCIDAGQGQGYCAIKPGALTCEQLGKVQITRNRVGTGGTLNVCAMAGGLDATCNADGMCINPCKNDSACRDPIKPHCNASTGQCVCTSTSCSGVTHSPVCNASTGNCECASDAHCTGVPNAEKCVNGACGCSSAAACTSDGYFDSTTWVCEPL